MINYIKHKIFTYLKPRFIDDFSTAIYSQEGEDMVLMRYFGDKPSGFYIDIGAHHPRRFSNTYLFYKKGWRGVNIDPNPDAIDKFKAERPDDINVCLPISDSKQLLTYYMFNEPALNTFIKTLADEYVTNPNFKIIDTREMETQPLGNVLDTVLSGKVSIDFMTIDVEGLDLNVLYSNDWNKYRPNMILVEFLNFNLKEFLNSELYTYLISLNYQFVAKTFNTVFFKEVK